MTNDDYLEMKDHNYGCIRTTIWFCCEPGMSLRDSTKINRNQFGIAIVFKDQVEYTAGTADDLRAYANHLRPHTLINLPCPTPPATCADGI